MVQDVASAYFELSDLDLELEIAKNTLESRQDSLQLTNTLEQGGATSLLDVRQAEQLVETAAETIPDTERQIATFEDMLSTLMGENPHDIPRGLALTEQPLPAEIPAGLPSALIERRPDIQQAEQQLIAANAQIGVARAQFFPSLPLTGGGGAESSSLSTLFLGSAWNFTAAATQPIFTAGRLRAQLKNAQAQQQQALLTYQETIQQAFRQVSDALVSYTKYRQFREHQELLTAASQGAADLSETRYRGGAASYLEVLTNETNYFAAELNLRPRSPQRTPRPGADLQRAGWRLGTVKPGTVRNQHRDSRSSSARLRSTPQRYPETAPSLRTTRWHGMATARVLAPQACATARADFGAPMLVAIWL